MDDAALARPAPDGTAELLDLLQTARTGSRELDARIDCCLAGRRFVGMEISPRYQWRADCGSVRAAQPPERWSDDLMALLQVIPADHNFSLGVRDSVIWAWIQPNDGWEPADHEVRHDHPRGSGLVVAHTVPLVLAAAMVTLRGLRGR
jgi:hypothetical protein